MTTNVPDSQASSDPFSSSMSMALPETPSTSWPETTIDAIVVNSHAAPKRLQPVRFASGLLLSTTGMGMILLVGIQMLEVQQLAGNFALALVALGILTGVTLLGGGFGLMATASSGFDENEFDRLLKAGNIASATMPIDPLSDSDTRSAA